MRCSEIKVAGLIFLVTGAVLCFSYPVEARRVREVFNLETIREEFGRWITDELYGLELGGRKVGLEILTRTENIINANPIDVLKGVLKAHLVDNTISEAGWIQIADEIQFFLDLPTDIAPRESVKQDDILSKSKIISELNTAIAIADEKSDKYFILAKNISHCVVVTFYDEFMRIGGMVYITWFPLFEKEMGEVNFARISSILKQFEKLGVNTNNLTVRMFGGKTLDGNNEQEVVFISKIYQRLKEKGVNIASADILGTTMLDVVLDTQTGYVYDLLK